MQLPMMLEEPALRPTDRLLLGPSAHHLVDFAMPRIVAAVAELAMITAGQGCQYITIFG